MTINNLFNEFNKYNTTIGCHSISSQYDKIIEFAGFLFCSNQFDELEKKDIYLKILTLYEQLDKED